MNPAAMSTQTSCLGVTAFLILLTTLILYLSSLSQSSSSPGGIPSTSPEDPNGPHVVVPISPINLPPPTGLPRNDAYLVEAQNGAVASEDITCSDMGVEVLRKGGNAVVSDLFLPV